MQQPKVSMVIPCYNKVQWIAAMFDSVLAQQWDNIELILVNDGSTDGTREIIADYEPKFRTRGYEVVIIDQENQGRAAAVKRGLMCVTGEYVCMPDCDDLLHPEYVSAMAKLIAKNENYDCIVCGYKTSPYDFENSTCLKRCVINEDIENEYPYKLLESVLLGRVSTSVCRGLFRVKSLKSAAVITSFVTEPRVAQEYQVWIPLALRNVRVAVCHRRLYHYNVPSIHNSEREHFVSMESISAHLAAGDETIKKTFQELGLCFTAYHAQLIAIRIYHIKQCFFYQRYRIYKELHAHEMVDYINKMRLLKREIETAVAERSGTEVLFRYFSNYVIGYPMGRVKICRKPDGGRIVAYAAFGMAANKVMKGLLNSDIRPDVFWDIAAKPDDRIEDIPVLKPALEKLTQNDTVLVLLKDITIAQYIKDLLDQSAAKDNIWYYFDVLDYLADFFFN